MSLFLDSLLSQCSLFTIPLMLQSLNNCRFKYSLISNALSGENSFFFPTLNTSDTKYIGVFPTSSNSPSQQTRAGCSTSLTLFWYYLEIALDPSGEGPSPIRRPPFQTPVVSSGCYLYFSLTSYKLGSHDHFLGSDNLLEWLTRFRETVACVCQVIIKAIIKDTDEQSDEEVHRARSRKVLSAGAGPRGTEGHPSPSTWKHSPILSSPNSCHVKYTWRRSKPRPVGLLWRLHYIDDGWNHWP